MRSILQRLLSTFWPEPENTVWLVWIKYPDGHTELHRVCRTLKKAEQLVEGIRQENVDRDLHIADYMAPYITGRDLM